MPVSMLGRGRGRMVPSWRSRSYCMNTRFQISMTRSPSPLGRRRRGYRGPGRSGSRCTGRTGRCRPSARSCPLAEAHHVVPGHAGLDPQLLGLGVGGDALGALEHRHPEAGGIQAQVALVPGAGHQLPGVADGVGLEVVAEAEVAQHLEEGVVARGEAHLVQVVVLAPGAQALLGGHGAGVFALLLAQEQVLELHHAGVGPHHRGVVGRAHHGAGGHHTVAAGGEVVQEAVAEFGSFHGSLSDAC